MEDEIMKMQVNERFLAMQIIAPMEGSFATLRMVRELSTKLGISGDEYKALKIQEKDGQITWDGSVDGEGKEFTFSEGEIELMGKALKALDESKKMKQTHFSLYEKIVENKGV
jgi:hypothetical protein